MVNAESKYIRVSPRKMLLLVKSIKLLPPTTAVVNLKFIKKSGSLPLRKVIESALANARQKNLNVEDMRFKELLVLPAGAMKRFRAVSRGMAHSYKKRMSHVKVSLEEKPKVDVKPIKQEESKIEETTNVKIKDQSEKKSKK